MPTVLITGTSTGFGHVTTELLAARGWRVFATMRDLKRKDSLEHALKGAGLSERVTFVQLDVTDPTSVDAAVKSVLAQTDNTLDAVVHNAGIAVAGVLEDLPESDVRRVMETNFFGVLWLTRALLPTLRAQGYGRIVLVSSQAALAGQPGNSMYCASKWALEGWSESLAYEVDPFGLDVVVIEPGPYRTQIWSSTKWVKPADSAYLPWLRRLSQSADWHQAKTSRDPKEVAVGIAKALEARRPTSATRLALSPNWITSCAARFRPSSSAAVPRAISACRCRGGSSALAQHAAEKRPRLSVAARRFAFARARNAKP
jgi:NAD(P)-dependent dehydrogenase (short-subunit alcohol dehydrogenase family)